MRHSAQRWKPRANAHQVVLDPTKKTPMPAHPSMINAPPAKKLAFEPERATPQSPRQQPLPPSETLSTLRRPEKYFRDPIPDWMLENLFLRSTRSTRSSSQKSYRKATPRPKFRPRRRTVIVNDVSFWQPESVRDIQQHRPQLRRLPLSKTLPASRRHSNNASQFLQPSFDRYPRASYRPRAKTTVPLPPHACTKPSKTNIRMCTGSYRTATA